MNDRMKFLKKEYDDIKIPDRLAAATEAAIQRAMAERENHSAERESEITEQQFETVESEKKKRHRSTRHLAYRWASRVGAGTAAAFLLFTVSINTMPAFANSLEQIPGLGTLVKTLQFDKNGAQGGQLTDSTDINVISLHKQDGMEQIVVHFQQDEAAQQFANAFHVKYSEYPDTMTFAIGGARRFSAAQDLTALQQSDFIKDAYEIVSLDDSLIRFNVTFKSKVEYEVQEYKEPAKVVLTIRPSKESQERPPVYSVRTPSVAYENLHEKSIYEETLMAENGLRLLKDREGGFFLEAGYFSSQQQAEAKLAELMQSYGMTQGDFTIEKRTANELPKALP
ncbi:DUF4179 domain-containing protein [Paenibacillus sp. GCM10027627]|uniref:DUF4179 domain-containing protein n=1 Tax=unclassified Paenibacillus TaxID=185978 RepID=UPI00363DF767